MLKKIVIPAVVASMQCFAGAAQAWQVKPEVSQKAASIIQGRMSVPQNYIPQSQDANFMHANSRSALQNQISTSIVDNDEEAIQLIEETYRQLNPQTQKPFTSQDVEQILSNDTPLITFLGLTNGLIELPDFYNTLKVYYNTNKMSFEKVIANLSPDMEKDFDMFIFINSGETATKEGLFPRGQRIKYFRRAHAGTPVFERDRNDQIIGVNASQVGYGIQTEAELAPYLNKAVLKQSMDAEGILTSTGIGGGGGLRTFSGIYRMGRTEQVHGKGMIYTMFIDYQYLIDEANMGKVSGLAIHGTPVSNVRRLGTRASHGCARIEPNLAGVWRSLMFNRTLKPGSMNTESVVKFPQAGQGWNLQKNDLMDFNRYTQVPSTEEQIKNPARTRPGYKALMIFFDGYENPGIAM